MVFIIWPMSRNIFMVISFNLCVTSLKENPYLKMKIKSMRSPKNTATLSMVRSITTSCLRRFGRKRTSFKILNSRNVRRTERPAVNFTNILHTSSFFCSQMLWRPISISPTILSSTLPVHLTRSYDHFFMLYALHIVPIRSL
jgi:hypothetical protein